MKLEDFHSWQIEAIKKAKEKNYRATIEAPTGSGKTRVAFGIRDCCLKHGEKTLIIVPAICLMEQWLIELRKTYPELYIKQYDRAKTYYDIAVSVIDSVRNEILDPNIKLIIFDEVHHYAAPTSWAFIVKNQSNRFLIGLSATLERSDGNEILIEKYMPVCYSSSIADAVSYGIIHDYDLKKVPVYLSENQRLEYESISALIRTGIKFFGDDVTARRSIRSFDHHTRKIAIDYMRALTIRKKFLSNLVQKAEAACSVLENHNTGQTLIFTQTIETTNRVANLLEKKGIKVGVYHSKISQKIRKETLNQFREGSLKHLAAPRALDEGIDISNAETAVITASNAISRQFIQRIGRILRKSAGKLPKVYYIYAVGTRDEQIMNELVRKAGK